MNPYLEEPPSKAPANPYLDGAPAHPYLEGDALAAKAGHGRDSPPPLPRGQWPVRGAGGLWYRWAGYLFFVTLAAWPVGIRLPGRVERALGADLV